ncbi:unnamed protein product [Arctogadus glacialis]
MAWSPFSLPGGSCYRARGTMFSMILGLKPQPSCHSVRLHLSLPVRQSNLYQPRQAAKVERPLAYQHLVPRPRPLQMGPHTAQSVRYVSETCINVPKIALEKYLEINTQASFLPNTIFAPNAFCFQVFWTQSGLPVLKARLASHC